MQKGYTLVELLVAITIAGVLSAIAYLSYINQRYKAVESVAITEMRGMVPTLQEYAVENRAYPPDKAAGESLTEVPWLTNPDLFDYDHWGIGEGMCIAQITWAGRNQINDRPAHTDVIPGEILGRFEDDLILVIDRYPCDNARGAVN